MLRRRENLITKQEKLATLKLTHLRKHLWPHPWLPKAYIFPVSLRFPHFAVDRWKSCLGTHCFKTLVWSLLDAFLLSMASWLWLSLSSDGAFTAVWHRLLWEPRWWTYLPFSGTVPRTTKDCGPTMGKQGHENILALLKRKMRHFFWWRLIWNCRLLKKTLHKVA